MRMRRITILMPVYVVIAAMALARPAMGEAGQPNTPAPDTCFHRLPQMDIRSFLLHTNPHHACVQACAPIDFKPHTVTEPGLCPSRFSSVVSTNTVEQCVDGAVNLHDCPNDQLNVTVTTLRVPPPESYSANRLNICHHKLDEARHKCDEACSGSGGDFKMNGLNGAGKCPGEYNVLEKQSSEMVCNDGTTSVKYCSGGVLKMIRVILTSKGKK